MTEELVIRGPILTISGTWKATGYDPEGKPFSIDLTGVTQGEARIEVVSTRDGYIAALRQELELANSVARALRQEKWRLLQEIAELRQSRKRWWRR